MEKRNNRESRIVTMAKRNSQFLIPYTVVDFRDSWVPNRPLPSQTYNPRVPSTIEEDALSLRRQETLNSLKDEKDGGDQVLGSVEIYDKDGNLRLVPVRAALLPGTCIVLRLMPNPVIRPRHPIPEVRSQNLKV
jgi:hypothetical protein